MKSLKDRFSKYNNEEVYFTIDNIKYKFLCDEYISTMTEYLNKKEYYGKKNYRDIIGEFLFDINQTFSGNRSSNFYSGRTFEKIFDEIAIKGRDPKNKKEKKKCIDIIKDMEKFFNKQFLADPENNLHTINKYINSLMMPLIDSMLESKFYSYLPHSTNVVGFEVYKNQLKNIEDNIEALFTNIKNINEEEKKTFDIWQEILKPIKNIIKNGDFPGIRQGLWIEINPKLAYFDCVYDIAGVNYGTYEKLCEKNSAKFCFSVTKEDVKNRERFFIDNGVKGKNDDEKFECEKKLFFKEFKKTYIEILDKKLNLKA